MGDIEFRFAVLVLTVAAWALTWLALHRGSVWLAAAGGYWSAMLVNGVAPHLVVLVLTHGYAPGVVTAVALNLPVNSYLLSRTLREKRLAPKALAAGVAVIVPTLLAAIPALFAIGRCLARVIPSAPLD